MSTDLFDKDDNERNNDDTLNKETPLFDHEDDELPPEFFQEKPSNEEKELFSNDEQGNAEGITRKQTRSDLISNKRKRNLILYSAIAALAVLLIVYEVRTLAARTIHRDNEPKKELQVPEPNQAATEASGPVIDSFDRYKTPSPTESEKDPAEAESSEKDDNSSSPPLDLALLKASERLSSAGGRSTQQKGSDNKSEDKSVESSEDARIKAVERAESKQLSAGLGEISPTPSGKTKISKDRYSAEDYQLTVAQREKLDPDLTISKGTFIPCVLQTKIVSTIAGEVSCVVPDDVYSESGHVLLLEKGSRVFGVYDSGELKPGEDRIFVIWQQIRTPDHLSIAIASNATDPLGGSGVHGQVDEHFAKRFGTALLVSFIADLSKAASSAIEHKTQHEGNGNVNISSNSNEATGIITNILQKEMMIQPTLYKNQGDTIGIFVARDIDFSNVYKLKLKSSRPW
jgi:cmgb10